MSSHQLVPIQSDDGTIIYIEAQENVENSPISSTPPYEDSEEAEQKRGGGKGWPRGGAKSFSDSSVSPNSSMQMVQNTLRSYTAYTLNAFKNFGAGNIDEVTLEFGINFSADAGVPYIANGKAQSSMKITVKCSYNNQVEETAEEATDVCIPQPLNGAANGQVKVPIQEPTNGQTYGEINRHIHGQFRQSI